MRAGMTLFVGVCLNIEQMAKSLVESELLFLTSDGVYVLDWVVNNKTGLKKTNKIAFLIRVQPCF